MNDLRVLIITNIFPPELGAASVRVFEYAKDLRNRGYEITVLTGFPNYPDGEIYPGYKNRLMMKEEIDGITVYRTLSWINKRASFAKRILMYMFQSFTNCFFVFAGGKFDVVMGWQFYIFTFAQGKLFALLNRAPFVTEIEDFIIERSEAVSGDDKPSFTTRVALKYSDYLYTHSDGIVVTTLPDKKYLLDSYPTITGEQIEVVENGVITDMFEVSDEDEENAIIEEYGLQDKFVILCIGNFGLTQGLDKFLRAAKILDDNFQFVFVGFGVNRQMLIDIVEKDGLSNIVMVGKQPRERIPYFLNVADIGVCSLEDVPALNRSLPSRISEYLAAGLPVLILAEGEPRRTIEGQGCGYYADKESPEEVADTLRRFAGDPQQLEVIGKRAREYAKERFERSKQTDKLDEFLKRITRIKESTRND